MVHYLIVHDNITKLNSPGVYDIYHVLGNTGREMTSSPNQAPEGLVNMHKKSAARFSSTSVTAISSA